MGWGRGGVAEGPMRAWMMSKPQVRNLRRAQTDAQPHDETRHRHPCPDMRTAGPPHPHTAQLVRIAALMPRTALHSTTPCIAALAVSHGTACYCGLGGAASQRWRPNSAPLEKGTRGAGPSTQPPPPPPRPPRQQQRHAHPSSLSPPLQVVELTEAGRQFFADVFERFDLDDDQVLSPREYEELFATAPSE